MHRDLKPANSWSTRRLGADHGLRHRAVRAGRQRQHRPRHRDDAPAPTDWATAAGDSSSLLNASTVAGVVVGTLEYMAPSRRRESRPTIARIFYAFGLIFYRPSARSGAAVRQPDAGERALTARMLQAPAPLRKRDASVPEPIDRSSRAVSSRMRRHAINRRGIADRPESARDDGVVCRSGFDAPAVDPWLAATLVAIAAIVGSTWWVARRRRPSRPADPVPVLVADFENPPAIRYSTARSSNRLPSHIEGASFITWYPRTSAAALAQQQ